MKNAFNKLRAGTLDLKTAFWGFKVGSILVFIVISFFNLPILLLLYVVVDFYILYKVMKCAINYHTEMKEKEQSSAFGYVIQLLLVINLFVLGGLLNATF